MTFFKQLLVFSTLALSAYPLQAQGIDQLIERYAGDNARGFVQPLVNAFGANLNSGFFYNAYVPAKGLHIDLRVNGMAAFFSDEQRVFTATTEGIFRPVQTAETSTIVGPGTGAVVAGNGGTNYTFPGGYDLSALAIVAPTVTIGSLYGSEVSLRYFSLNTSEDLGKLKLFSLGGRHSISQYIPDSPVDLAVGLAYTAFSIGTVVELDQVIYHAEVGKRLPFFSVFGGTGIEHNAARLDYTITNSEEIEEDIEVIFDDKNAFRIFLGFSIDLSILHLTMDYSLGSQNILNAGFSFGQ